MCAVRRSAGNEPRIHEMRDDLSEGNDEQENNRDIGNRFGSVGGVFLLLPKDRDG